MRKGQKIKFYLIMLMPKRAEKQTRITTKRYILDLKALLAGKREAVELPPKRDNNSYQYTNEQEEQTSSSSTKDGYDHGQIH